MKFANWFLAMALVALSGLAAAQTMGSATRLVTEVPFEFVVANRVVPAGECVIQTANMDGSILSIRNSDAKVNLVSSAILDESKKASSSYSLVFSQYGDRYFLTGIKLEGSKVTYRLPVSKAEAELRARNVTPSEEILLASRR